MSVRYVTLRPRSRAAAGHVLCGRRPPPTWRHAGALTLAGMAAEQLVITDRPVVAHGGAHDLRDTRDMVRSVLALRDDPADTEDISRHPGWARWRAAALGIDPTWSEADAAADMWRAAVDLVVERRAAIDRLAALLVRSTAAVTGKQVRAVFDRGERDHEPPAPHLAEWWPPRYSRLKWRARATAHTAA